MYYYFGNENAVDVYQSNLDFFLEGDIQKGPALLQKLTTIAAPTVRYKAIPSFLEETAPKSNFWTKIKQIFSA
jgi:hypothetical protein